MTEQPNVPEQPPAISINDIALAMHALTHSIDAAVESGSWKTWASFQEVYMVRNRFRSFLEYVAANQEQQTTQQNNVEGE